MGDGVTAATARFTVGGRVQGVWFRDSTRNVATELGISGHAINLENGDVEVLASGTPEALQQLKTWLRQGPPLASVTRVDETPLPPQTLSGFRIG
ncbi:MAG: acylphosphatase [Gammaproteobacteria bacterium]|nr:acylphosphatase [Gammaproteobacteria bacterium]